MMRELKGAKYLPQKEFLRPYTFFGIIPPRNISLFAGNEN